MGNNTAIHALSPGNITACPLESNPVSWPSALWGLIALSLNSMTQRSASDRFPSSDSLSPSRSSPFVCIADILVSVLWLVKGFKHGLGVKGSLHWFRKEMGLVRDKSDRELIQGVPAVTICFFILGPLPQAIKIFGAHGLYWTKAWAAVLFSAWVWEVMVRFIAALPRSVKVDTDGVGSRVRSRDLKQLSRILYQIDFMAQFAVWLWILVILSWSRAPREYIGFFFGALLWVVGLVYGGLLLGIALVILLLYALSSISRLAATIFLICASVGWTVYWFYAVYLMDWSYAILLWLIRVSEALSLVVGLPLLSGTIYLFVSASTALLLAFDSILVILGQEVEGSLEREPFLSSEADTQSDDQTLMTHQRRTSLGANEEGQNVSSRRITRCSARSAETIALGKFFHRRKLEVHQNRRVRAITFALANLLFTSLYYFFKYYSYGTVKPSWTDMLG